MEVLIAALLIAVTAFVAVRAVEAMRRCSVGRWFMRDAMEDLDDLIREKVWEDIENGKAGSTAQDYGLRSNYAFRRFDELRVREGHFKARVLRVMKMRERG